ncbi:MAG: DUF1569 domain-containing protein [Planctomycetota bacterium]
MQELDPSLGEGRKAVADFVSHARSVARDRWSAPRAPGKWSAAQVCDHVAKTYEEGRSILCGTCRQKGMPRWVRPLLRFLFLNRVLKTGNFPKGAKAPAAFEPSANPPPAVENLRRLEKAAADFEGEARARDGTSIDHPVFGRIKVVDYVRLNAIHTRHHMGQLGA